MGGTLTINLIEKNIRRGYCYNMYVIQMEIFLDHFVSHWFLIFLCSLRLAALGRFVFIEARFICCAFYASRSFSMATAAVSLSSSSFPTHSSRFLFLANGKDRSERTSSS